MPDYRIGKLKGRFVLVFTGYDGKRRRARLIAKNADEARRVAPGAYAELTRPRGKTVTDLWLAYTNDKAGRAVIGTMAHTWKALRGRFGGMEAEAITVNDCRAHIEERRSKGIKDGTLLTELGHLRMVMNWAEKQRIIIKAPYIERPPKPKPREKHLTKTESRTLIDAATMPHIRLYIVLALGTGARNAALLDLTWERCDFDRGMINLRNPDLSRPHKGRAVVPMTRTVRAALLAAKPGAISDHVIEWAGKRVASIKRGLRLSAKRAGLGAVSPHILRHSAAVHMAESGIPMEEIAQFLGHSNVNTTREVYARFSPDYLRKAAEALEYDDLADVRTRKVQ